MIDGLMMMIDDDKDDNKDDNKDDDDGLIDCEDD